MEKQQLLGQVKETLTPFETANVIDFIQNLTLKSAMEQPWLIGIFLVFAFYAVIRRSKVVLIFLFAGISIILLVRFTLAPEVVGGGLTVGSVLPFAAGGIVIGGALIYFSFIKGD